ncbi:MAG: hypothetical protein AAF676_15670 [Pseudomonadota bacterium]
MPGLALDFEVVVEGIRPVRGSGVVLPARDQLGFVMIDAAVDGDSTFAVPDMRGRTPMGAYFPFVRLGERGGQESLRLTVDRLP